MKATRGKSSFAPFKKSMCSATPCPDMFDQKDFDSQSNESDYYVFDPKIYLWLFNPEMRFNKRPGFCIDEEVKPHDYLKMREINRRNLTKFLKRVVRNKNCFTDSPSKLLDNYDSLSTD